MSKYRKTELGEDKTVGYGWVARWRDGSLGYILPDHLGHGNNKPAQKDWFPPGMKGVLCKITVEVVGRSDGRRIGKTLKDG
jgi:hypothetical protein